MKLEEALQERADLNIRISQLRNRIGNNILVQEGEKPTEDPEQLLKELDAAIDRQEFLIRQINLSNCHYRVDGLTLTEMIARKDMMNLRIGALRDMASEASRNTMRARGSEIKILPVLSASALQKRIDQLSRDLRLLDNRLQESNWQFDLLE